MEEVLNIQFHFCDKSVCINKLSKFENVLWNAFYLNTPSFYVRLRFVKYTTNWTSGFVAVTKKIYWVTYYQWRVCWVLPHLQWTLRDCLAHRTHLRPHPHTPPAEQTRSWFAGRGPKAYRLPCTQDCQPARAQAPHWSIRQNPKLEQCIQYMCFWGSA